MVPALDPGSRGNSLRSAHDLSMRYGTIPEVGKHPKRLEPRTFPIARAVVFVSLCLFLVSASKLGPPFGRHDDTDTILESKTTEAFEWRVNIKDVRNADWLCADFDDEQAISPEECGFVDEMMCKDHCVSRWCQDLCEQSCAKGEGALCAYKLLSDLATTCNEVQRVMLSRNLTIASELELAAQSHAVVRDKCRPLADTRVENPRKDELIDPRNKNGYPMCDHHAWCSFCAGSETCERIVPKARAPERVESGGCAAASLGRIVSICDEAGQFDNSIWIRKNATEAVDLKPTLLRKIYYINCDSATDRRALQEEHLGRLGVPYERFSCVSGETVEDVLQKPEALEIDVRGRPKLAYLHNVKETTHAHTIGTWISHYVLFDRIARMHADDPEGLYLVLEDDAILDPRFSIADIDRISLSLPADWAYASLNVHESYCLEDRINEDWFLKRARLDATLYDSERAATGRCTPVTKDDAWRDSHILYLSAAAQLLRPATASKVVDWLDSRPVYHVDAILRTPNASTFPSFQFKENMFYTAQYVSETRIAPVARL